MWILLTVLGYVFFWLTCILSYTIHYLTSTIQITSFSQVIYTLNAGTEGAEGTIGTAVFGFFEQYWMLLLLGTLVFAAVLGGVLISKRTSSKGASFFSRPKIGTVFNCSIVGALLVTSSCFSIRAMHGYSQLGIGEYLANKNRKSNLFETKFVEPDEADIAFPAKKRNLIHIVLESMESSYADPSIGGGYKNNLIKNLTNYAKEEGTDFSAASDGKLNGAWVTDNCGWTIAGLVAQTSGIPLNAGHETFRRDYAPGEKFMPNLTTLGDLLLEEGYNSYFMCGSAATYAGRASYYQQHGKYMLLDLNAARTTGFIPADYSQWWGYEDEKLFEWAKKRITLASQSDKPFNFTILSADTHFPSGYECPDCPDTYDTQYENVIACSDAKVREFIDWLKTQDFYDNTTIVLSGDHLSMDGSVGQTVGADYERKVYAAVINGPQYTLDKTREFCTMDLFPTILESIGAKIEGGRLGLGTSLYQDVPTLIESMGLKALNADLVAESDYYNDVILSGTTIETIEAPAKKETEDAENPVAVK